MGGYKGHGQMQQGYKRHQLLPDNCSVNFVVPSEQILQQEAQRYKLNCQHPSILINNIQQFGSLVDDASCKLCFDGKKLTSGFGKVLDEVDMIGCEATPTLQEKNERLAQEKHVIVQIKDIP